MLKKICLLFLIALSLCSCASRSKIIYFGGASETGNNDTSQAAAKNFETRIKTDDLLMILIGSSVPGVADRFNLPAVGVMDPETMLATGRPNFQNYLVDNKGNIVLPVLGTMKIGGLTRDEAMEKMKAELVKYIKDPIINLRITNYKISVMGEVARPGSHPIVTERITIPEALSLSGDLTIYGDRKDIILIREIDGVKTYNSIDLTDSNIINSPYYYLTQNDILYVKPNKTRVNSSVVGPNLTVGISAISLLITVVAILTR